MSAPRLVAAFLICVAGYQFNAGDHESGWFLLAGSGLFVLLAIADALEDHRG